MVHAAAQPSHDLAAQIPFDDFDVNAVGTLNLLEAVRIGSPEAVFVHMSTNKVYGDRPNFLPLVEQESRFDYEDAADFAGVREMSIDSCLHSLFGASKVAGDVLVQEYGRYFGMRTCSLRGGCLTGPNHSGVDSTASSATSSSATSKAGPTPSSATEGKQVRDNIHSRDVASFIHALYRSPRIGEVYNIGGGRSNSCSILEAFERAERLSKRPMRFEYRDEPRRGDHICYISDLSKARTHFPGWNIRVPLDQIFEEIHKGRIARSKVVKPLTLPPPVNHSGRGTV